MGREQHPKPAESRNAMPSTNKPNDNDKPDPAVLRALLTTHTRRRDLRDILQPRSNTDDPNNTPHDTPHRD